MHAEVQIGDSVVMVGAWRTFDAVYQRALEAGGIAVKAPERRRGDPDRRGGVKDPTGNTWWIATQMT